jgi:hypothetical protein
VGIRRGRPYIFVLLAAFAAALAFSLPSTPALAATPTSGTWWIGAPLETRTANKTESSPEDDLFYLIFDALNNPQNGYTMPYDGQITAIQTEGGFLTQGGVPENPVDTMVHFQDLTPAGNGSWLVNATSGFVPAPTSAEPGALAHLITEYHPENLCVHQGDVVAINTEGGFEASQPAYTQGVPLLMFEEDPSSTTGFFRGHEKTGNGSIVQPTTLASTLLMRVQLAVGSNATPLCPGGTQGLPTPTPTLVTEAPTLAELSPPVLYKTADVATVSGTVYIELPPATTAQAGRAHAAEIFKGQRFVPLKEARQIPFGSELDTRRGTVAVVTASSTSATAEQTAQFQFGVFGLLQSRSQLGLVTGQLIDARSRKGCRIGKIARAHDAAKLSKTVLSRLRAQGQGKFRTSGSYSSATVRGTQWEMLDQCDGTLTRVKRGVVIVRDFRMRRNITVSTGKSYLARAP